MRARLALAGYGVDEDLADARLAEVARHCAESGQDPEAAFGAPADFAVTIAAEYGPEPARAEHLSRALRHTGILGALLAGAGWLHAGWMTPVHTAGLAGTALFLGAAAGVQGVDFLRVHGRPRAAGWAVGGVAVTVVLAAVAYTGPLPRGELFGAPSPLLVALGVALLVWGWRREERAAPPRPASDDERWLRDLAGLLEGRYGLSRQRAREVTAETAARLTEPGATARQEFGPVEEHAHRLAEHEPARPPWWWRASTLRWVRPPLLALLLVVNVAEGGRWWLSAALLLVLALDLWSGFRRGPAREE